MLLAAVAANHDVQARAIPWDQGDREADSVLGTEFFFPAATVQETLKQIRPDGTRPLSARGTEQLWRSGVIPSAGAPDNILNLEGLAPFDGKPGEAPGKPSANPGRNALTAPRGENLDATLPRLSDEELATWKKTEESNTSDPEDWLFRRQFIKVARHQAAEPEPLIPIPEPATAMILLLGLAGMTTRGGGRRPRHGRG
jgi:hypothetical protein